MNFLPVSAHSPALVTLGVISLGLVVGLIVQGRKMKAMERRWETVLGEAQGRSVFDALSEHFLERRDVQEVLVQVRGRLDILDEKVKRSKRFVGLVRYDAFEDVRGGQSFSLSIYDEEGNGVVVTSVVGRELGRVYVKELVQGTAAGLSQEEEQAIRAAVKVGGRESEVASR